MELCREQVDLGGLAGPPRAHSGPHCTIEVDGTSKVSTGWELTSSDVQRTG